MMGSGTTRDVVAWLNDRRPSSERIEFWGTDLSEGFDLRTDPLPRGLHMLWVHPPYWNMIRYSEDSRDLSTLDSYRDFWEALHCCLRRCSQALARNGRLAVLVGDVRRRGIYVPIIRDVLLVERDLGLLKSIIIKAQHNCWSDRKDYGRMEEPRIAHEFCAIFKRS
jgi:hypothetical protein